MAASAHRVLLVKGNYVRAGGPETLLESTFTWLDRQRFEPTLVLLRKPGGPEVPGLLAKVGPDCREIVWRGLAAAPMAAWELKRLAGQSGACLLDAHDMRANLTAYLLTRVHRRPWIARAHGWLGPTHSGRWRLYERIEQYLVKRADLVLVGCEAARQECEALGIRRLRIVRQGIELPHPVSADAVRHIRSQVGADAKTTIVGVVGRLHPGKGQDLLVRAIAQLRERELDVRGLIVGEGPFGDALQRLVTDLGLMRNVMLAGYQADLLPYLAAMDAVVIPSLKDGLSLAKLEAMALERPVVVSEVGGLPEGITHGETGYLVPPGDAAALAEALDPLIRDAELRRQIGERAREAVLAHFTAELMIRNLEAAYSEVLACTNGER
jgi:glycosyltransferase involved in cell wall biosynthesis